MDNKKNPEKYTGKMETPITNKVQVKIEKKVNIMFRENRKFDLHIGRNMITFLGRESKPVPVSWLKHKDWFNVSKYFIVKGV
jgi:hypothetical protein